MFSRDLPWCHHEYHGGCSVKVEGPIAATAHFDVVIKIDVTFKPQGKRHVMLPQYGWAVDSGYMPQILVQPEQSTLTAIDRIAPAAKRQRAEFIRMAIKDAIFRHEQERMRDAYLHVPVRN